MSGWIIIAIWFSSQHKGVVNTGDLSITTAQYDFEGISQVLASSIPWFLLIPLARVWEVRRFSDISKAISSLSSFIQQYNTMYSGSTQDGKAEGPNNVRIITSPRAEYNVDVQVGVDAFHVFLVS